MIKTSGEICTFFLLGFQSGYRKKGGGGVNIIVHGKKSDNPGLENNTKQYIYSEPLYCQHITKNFI